MELRGKYNSAKVYVKPGMISQETISQIVNMLNLDGIGTGLKIRFMPDASAGKGSVVGTTMKMGDGIIPNLIGTDIGCGVSVAEVKLRGCRLTDLDSIIRSVVPMGSKLHNNVSSSKMKAVESMLKGMKMTGLSASEIASSLGTLGGGNHFIEIAIYNSRVFVLVHTGSRLLGKKVAEHYQSMADHTCNVGKPTIDTKPHIEKLKKEGKHDQINAYIEEVKNTPYIPKGYGYLVGFQKDKYLNDLRIAQEFAKLNRDTILDTIFTNIKSFQELDRFDCSHNNIGDDNIIRKGAISAKEDERVVIPINMAEGSIIGRGKGNKEWNHSAPHGAGRLVSVGASKVNLTMDEFREDMEGVISTSITSSNLGESPRAYKPKEAIMEMIHPTVEVLFIAKPILSIKA